MSYIRAFCLIAALAALSWRPADVRAADVYGATSIDTSAFALGKLRLNVIFVESNGSIDVNQENWTAAQLSNVHSEINEVVSFWEGQTAGYHPNAQLKFDVNYVNGGVPLATGYEPIRRASFQDSFWINQVMGTLGYDSPSHFDKVRQFDNDQRIAADAHWAVTLFVVNDEVDTDNRFSNSQFAYAYHGGPYLVTTYGNDGWGIDRYNRVLSHELAHSFFALDEYAAAGVRNNETSGYLGGVNGNSELNANGQPITAPQPNALMLNNTLDTSEFTDIQVGHWDSDHDGIPDILDSAPILSGGESGSDPTLGKFGFAGSAVVTTVPNLNTNQLGFSSSGNAMTINWIEDAQYRVDGGAWIDFTAFDGSFDEGLESLAFSLSGLSAGTHAVDVRAINSVDLASNVMTFTFRSAMAVPEPSALVLAALALPVVAWSRRWRDSFLARRGG